MDMGGFCRVHDLIHGGIRNRVSDVFGDGAVKEERVLQDRGDAPPETLHGNAPDIMTVDQDKT